MYLSMASNSRMIYYGSHVLLPFWNQTLNQLILDEEILVSLLIHQSLIEGHKLMTIQ